MLKLTRMAFGAWLCLIRCPALCFDKDKAGVSHAECGEGLHQCQRFPISSLKISLISG
jgi:hypothetical protein